MRQRSAVLTALSGLGVAVLIAACTPAAVKDNNVAATNNPTAIANAAAGTDTCMTCHGDGTVLNDKIQNARDSWMTSGHAKGQVAALLDSTGKPIGEEMEGADSFYANGGGCQVCHTKEGFNKKISGKYADAAAEAADQITNPSTLTCFTCHKPHTNGNFDLVVPGNKPVTLISGAVYDKTKGSLCASCHMARTTGGDGAKYSLTSVTSTNGLSDSWGSHHGPQADLLLGKAGAQYAGKTYSSAAHTSLKDANCVSCHMSYPEKRVGLSPNVAGHSFQAVGMVHGGEVANTAGCVSCHPTMKATNVGASGALTASGHLRPGMAYFDKGDAGKHYADLNTLLTALVDPDNSGKGLIPTAFKLPTVATKSLTVSTDGRGTLSGYGKFKDLTAGAASPSVRFAMALYNYKYVKEDKSFGIHNGTYALQLLYDSCKDLIDLGATTSVDINTVTRP